MKCTLRHSTLIHTTVSLSLIFATLNTHADDVPALPTAPNFTTQNQAPPPPPKPNDDRAGSQGAAAAMAAVGAAMAGMSCMLMMQQAQKEEDPQQKRLLQLMALQQCAQAAQSAMAAAQNDKGKKQLTQADIPQQPGFAAPPPVKAPSDGSKQETQTASDDSGDNTDTPTDKGLIPMDPLQQPTVAKADKDIPHDFGAGKLVPDIATSIPNRIDKAMVTANENAKENDPSIDANANVAGLGGTYAGKSPSGEDLKKATSDGLSAANGNDKAVRKASKGDPEISGGGSEGSGSSGSKESGGDSFDQMLAQLLGGGQAGGEVGLGNAAGELEVAALPKAKNKNASINIFQYATLRYDNLTHSAGRVKVRLRAGSQPERGLSSVTNSVIKASIP